MSQLAIADYDSSNVECPDYTSDVFDVERFLGLVEKAALKVEAIRALHPQIEALACCGNSGIILAGALSAKLGLPLIVVRKSKEQTHDYRMVNGYLGAKAYLFIDDLISSGTTLKHVVHSIREAAKNKLLTPPVPIGCLLYEQCSDNWPIWFKGEQRSIHAGWIAGRVWGINAQGLELSWRRNQDKELARALGGPAPVVEEQQVVTSYTDIPLTFSPPLVAGKNTPRLPDIDADPPAVKPDNLTVLYGAKYGNGWNKGKPTLSIEDVAEAFTKNQAADKVISINRLKPGTVVSVQVIKAADPPREPLILPAEPYFDENRGRWSFES